MKNKCYNNSGQKDKLNKKAKCPRGEKMKYVKICEEISKRFKDGILKKEDLKKIIKEIYKTENEKTIRNIVGILKRNNIIKEVEKNKYIIVTKNVYKYNEENIENRIYKLIQKEYPKIDMIVWNTKILNEFTLHYAVNNYIIVEVEKMAIELVVNLLKEHFGKKITVTTSKILSENKEMFLNEEQIIIVKQLISKSPLEKIENKKYITIEKIMVDLYVDKLYLSYQGKELENIYENIFEKYDINLKRLIKYASLCTDINKYKQLIYNLNIPKKYKLKE